MTREEAKEILTAYRPGTRASDPEIAEALRLAESDAELGQWLERQRDFNASIAKEFQAIEPPADLKARILAGKPSRAKSTWIPKRRQILAIAAGIVLALTLADFFVARNRNAEDSPTFANFRSRMTSFALRTYQMDIVTNNPAAVRGYLASHGAPADFPLTANLEKLPVKGGGRLSWQNQPVAMMCFALTNNQTAFMFVVDQGATKQKPPQFEVSSTRTFSSVAWTQGGKLYLLAAAEPADVLASLAR